jgi:chromosome segregation ATPase
MPPGKNNADTASNKATTKQSGQIRTASIVEADSSRLFNTSDAMSTSTEPAIAAMVDVSSWAQRGLVLENKEIRRSLEMLKSGHAAQLAQISKRHKTEKEELEIKLQAETYRQVDQQRTVDQLSGQVRHLQEENEKLVGNIEELATEMTNKAEQNALLQQEYENTKLSLTQAQEQYHHLESQYEQLKSRDSRVTAMVNEQHDKIIRLSHAYNVLEEQEKQSREAAKMAEKEVDRLKSRLSSILSTLAKVVGENQDEQVLEARSESEQHEGKETLQGHGDAQAGGKGDHNGSCKLTVVSFPLGVISSLTMTLHCTLCSPCYWISSSLDQERRRSRSTA